MQEMPVQYLGWKDPPEGGNGNLLQYFCLDNPMDRGAYLCLHNPMGLQRIEHNWVTEHMHTHSKLNKTCLNIGTSYM